MSDSMNDLIRSAAGRNRFTVYDQPPESEGSAAMNRALRGQPDLRDPEVQEAYVDRILAEREERKQRRRGSADQGPRGQYDYQEPPPSMDQIIRWNLNRLRRVQAEDRY